MGQIGWITPVVKHGNDEELIAANTRDQREGEPAEQDSAAVACDRGEGRWITHPRSDGNVNGPGMFEAKADRPRRLPRLRLQNFGPGLWQKEDAHQR